MVDTKSRLGNAIKVEPPGGALGGVTGGWLTVTQPAGWFGATHAGAAGGTTAARATLDDSVAAAPSPSMTVATRLSRGEEASASRPGAPEAPRHLERRDPSDERIVG